MNKKIELSKRPAAMVDLENWCIMSAGRNDKGDFLEVTEWTNGEGYDIHISDVDGQKTFTLTWGQFEAMKKCIKAIQNEQK
jgi:hypothetical protein